jgi:hypothetical protein
MSGLGFKKRRWDKPISDKNKDRLTKKIFQFVEKMSYSKEYLKKRINTWHSWVLE